MAVTVSDEEFISRIYEKLLQVNHELSLPEKHNGKRLVVHKKILTDEIRKMKIEGTMRYSITPTRIVRTDLMM